MEREPLGFYIIRIATGIALAAFMGLLWWSSNLLEEQVQEVRRQNRALHTELSSIRSAIERASPCETQSVKNIKAVKDGQYPNLLEPDPFYEKILPTLLGKDFKPHGTRKQDILGKPSNLHPFSNWKTVSQLYGYCIEQVAKQRFGIWETQSPSLAVRLEERPGKFAGVAEFWVHLRNDIFWVPLSPAMFNNKIDLAPWFLKRHPVTAHDFKFHLDATMNPHVSESGAMALRSYLKEIEEIEVVDDRTFIVRWKAREIELPDGKKQYEIPYSARLLTGSLQPLPSFVYQYFPDGTKIVEDDSDPGTYRANSVWAQNFSQHWAKNIIISCGPWVFEKMTANQIILNRNPGFYDSLAALTQRQEITIRDNPDSLWQDFKEGKTDTFDLQPELLIEWKKFQVSKSYQQQKQNNMAIKQLEYVGRNFYYIGWNEATHYFNNRNIRQAMTMAIDRQRIINDILNGMGVELTAPFSVNSPSYNSEITPYPFDPDESIRLLEREGWFDTDGDGIRDKLIEGKRIPFKFSLTYYSKSPITAAICDYIATAFKKIGVACELNGVDIGDLSSSFDGKSFDAIFLGWSLAPPPEKLDQLWHSSGAFEAGSSNAIGFVNSEVDRIIETLRYEKNKAKRKKLYHRFHKIIHEEAPYTFLYTPKSLLLYREYLHNVFIPADRQDLIPGANIDQPQPEIWWIRT